jgi:pantoate--beta-alanine ligase
MEMLIKESHASDLQSVRAALASPVVFIPTMGALHHGHAELIRHGASLSKSVIVSIFVNPLQFEDPEDLAKYPKQLEADRKIALDAGASFIWAPSFNEVYPDEIERIPSGRIGTILEGASRSGHFDGVLTVVKRLFESVQPSIAIFGEKDYQQLFLIKRLAKEMGVEIIAHPTVRDENGLALSSRNARLSKEGKRVAAVIYRALTLASRSDTPHAAMHEAIANEKDFTLDYAEVIDEESFDLVGDENRDTTIQRRALIAGWVEGIRLIDNMKIESVS